MRKAQLLLLVSVVSWLQCQSASAQEALEVRRADSEKSKLFGNDSWKAPTMQFPDGQKAAELDLKTATEATQGWLDALPRAITDYQNYRPKDFKVVPPSYSNDARNPANYFRLPNIPAPTLLKLAPSKDDNTQDQVLIYEKQHPRFQGWPGWYPGYDSPGY